MHKEYHHYQPTNPRRAGLIYLIRIEGNKYKIGRTANLKKRLRVLMLEYGEGIEVTHTFYSLDSIWKELELHRHFDDQCIERELFTLTNEDVQYIRSYQDETLENYAAFKVKR